MTHSRTSSRHASSSRYRSSSRQSSARRDSRSPERPRQPSSRRSSRSRSPHPRDGRNASLASAGNTSSADGSDDKKKKMMQERLAMWRRRKEQEKSVDQSPAASASERSTASQESAVPADIPRPESRASSLADDSSPSAPFVTAPGSVASEPCSASESGDQLLATGVDTRPAPAALGQPSRPLHALGVGVMPKAGQRNSFGNAKMSLGKISLKSRRPLVKSTLGSSVFSAAGDADEDKANKNARQKRPLVPLISSADLSDTTGSIAQQQPGGEPEHKSTAEPATVGVDMDVDTPEVDSLEAYMQTVETQMVDQTANHGDADINSQSISAPNSRAVQVLNEDDAVNFDDGLPDEPEDVLAMAARKLKKKDLAAVDHSKMNYESFKKNFYIEPAELRNMSPSEVETMREDLGGIKIRGVDPPKPAHSWSHFGLPAACADVIKLQGFKSPTPIQAQAVPAILSGRDVIGVAKTGSGKTLAFLLPMLRHIKAQRSLAQGEGPIGLVMTPTRELAVQIHRECKPFLKPLGLRAVCAYGGSAIKDQIGELKRGAEIVVCTPGRMIDLLCANSGRVTNLHRVTYLVLDEADRMFDMGFEPQVTKIVQGVRPSRQTVLFSATFPRQMEALARKVLKRPLEIVVGGRALIPPEVTQHVEIVEARDKFFRLLAILGEAFNANSETLALIFVDRQEAADGLLRDLMQRGYVCNSLHGGKDQTDRDQAIADFKNRVFSVLIATSVAARGLDVRGLNVVVNFDCPNHMEDLVHRVGRTGRAGNKGDAYTFITPDQDRYASEVVRAMKLSGLIPPADVQEMADSFMEKVRQGKERHSSKSGFGGKGLEKLDKDRDMVKKMQKITYGGGASGDVLDDDDEGEDEEVREIDSDGEAVAVSNKLKSKPKGGGDQTPNGEVVRRRTVAATATQSSKGSGSGAGSRPSVSDSVPQAAGTTSAAPSIPDGISPAARAALLAAQAAARRLNVGGIGSDTQSAPLSVIDQINQQLGIPAALGQGDSRSALSPTAAHAPAAAGSASSGVPGNALTIPMGEFSCEIEINDYPQKARWRATNKETLTQIIEQTGTAITTRGIFVPAGKPLPEGERKLYLSIESDSERSVEQAKNELKRILTEATIHVMEQEARAGGSSGRYSVV